MDKRLKDELGEAGKQVFSKFDENLGGENIWKKRVEAEPHFIEVLKLVLGEMSNLSRGKFHLR